MIPEPSAPLSGFVSAAPSASAPDTSTNAPPPLPVREVVLFSSGVSYTLRAGEVSAGAASVVLTFRTTQINDLLKSLVLLDEGGAVQPATYPSRDPIGRTLRAFAIDVTDNLSRADLLRRLRGARVSVETIGRETLSGQIVGVEEREDEVGQSGRVVTIETLTLLGENGLEAVEMGRVRTLRLLDERLDREFREALSVLASGSDDARRQVTLRFAGEAARTVRVGYVSEAPLWKMSYRLVLGDENNDENAKPYLQGWALVENTTDDDWNDVRLSLVSGRPISFIQDLYQPLYVPRPEVGPDVIASPFPQTHGGDLLAASEPPPEIMMAAASPAPVSRMAMAKRAAAGYAAVDERAVGYTAMSASAVREAAIPTQAEGRGAGELFRYDITTPVRLPRQQAAMIPVVAGDVDGEKLSLFNPETGGSRFPLNAVRLSNNTGLHLKGGPVTLFDDGAYAGDARMEDIPPGDNRLLTYAVDLSVEGERQQQQTGPATLTAFSVRRGVLTVTSKSQSRTRYVFKSKAARPRKVLVEHPFSPDWTLAEPAEPAERTRDWYRFVVSLPSGETRTLEVVVERPNVQTVALLDGSVDFLTFYTTNGKVPEAIRAALTEVVRRRRANDEAQAGIAGAEAEAETIGREQERIRNNMAELDRASALYNRYVDELDQQETRLKILRAEAQRLREQARAALADLRAYLDALTLGDEHENAP